MKPPEWSRKDYETAISFLVNREEDALVAPVLQADYSVTVIMPYGVPKWGATFHGIFMAAPLLLFMVVLALFPVFGFLNGWNIDATSSTLTTACILLLWGLVNALLLLTKNRDLFPIRHFTTLGNTGVASHFSWMHYPGGKKTTAIPWEEVKTIRQSRGFYFPAMLTGPGSVATVEIVSTNGDKIEIPIHPSKENSSAALSEIEAAIKALLKKGG